MTRATRVNTGWLALAMSAMLVPTAWALPTLAQDLPTSLYATEIAPLPGHSAVLGYAINGGGEVVGHSLALGDAGPSVGPFMNVLDAGAFLWLPEPAYGLSPGTHEIPRIATDSIQVAEGMNDLGQVVGWAAQIEGDELTDRRTLLWLPEPAYGLAAGSHDLGANGGPASGVALDINELGQVVGVAFDLDSGFIWDEGVMLELPGLAGGDGQSIAQGLNDLGEVVGRSRNQDAGLPRATLWLPEPAYDLPAGAHDLHADLASLEALHSSALDINNAGQVLGSYTFEAADGSRQDRAFVWNGGVAIDLGTLGGTTTLPMDLNNLGQVVGVSATTDGAYMGFVWHDTEAMEPEMAEIADLLVPPQPIGAMAISDRSEFAGTAVIDGIYRGFLLRPIEPIAFSYPTCQPCMGYARIWVDANANPDTADGRIDTPFVTLDEALARAEMWELCAVSIVLDDGEYNGFEVARHTQILGRGPDRVTLVGSIVNTKPFKLEVQNVLIAPDDAGEESQGAVVVANPDAVTVLQHIRIEQARRFGVRQQGGQLFLQDATISGTRAEDDDVLTGTAVYADEQAVCVLADVMLTENESGALAIRGEGTTAYAERMRVEDTGHNPHFFTVWEDDESQCQYELVSENSGAVNASDSALLLMRSSDISGSTFIGLDVSENAHSHLQDCDISETQTIGDPYNCWAGGWNLRVRSGAIVEAHDIVLSRGVVGLGVDQSYAAVTDGEIAENLIGIWLAPPDDPAYEVMTCINNVRLIDNSLEFQSVEGPTTPGTSSLLCSSNPTAPECGGSSSPPPECPEVPFEVPSRSDDVDIFTDDCNLWVKSNLPDLFVIDGSSRDILRYSGNAGAFIDRYIPAGSGGMDLPSAMAFGPDDLLYVCSAKTSSVLRFDATTGELFDELVSSGSGGLSLASGLTFDPLGDLLVSSHDTDSVLRFDGETGASLGAFVAPGSGGLDEPRHLEIGPDGYLYVASGLPNRILRFDALTGAFVDHFIGDDPDTDSVDESDGHDIAGVFAFGPDGDLYLPELTSAGVLRYDGATGDLVGEVVDVGEDLVERFGGWAQVAALTTLTFGPGDDLYVGALVGIAGDIVPEGELFASAHGFGLMLRYDADSGELRDVLVGDDPGTLSRDEGGELVLPVSFAFYSTEATSTTEPGSNVVVVPVDSTTGGSPVTLTFALVTEPGVSTLETNSIGPEPNPGWGLPAAPPVYYNVETTAEFEGGVTVCIEYDDSAFEDESGLGLFHYEDGEWEDSTTSHDPDGNVICGEVTTLSPFATLEPVNYPPEAQVVVEQLSADPTDATVLLDGSGSSDADHPQEALAFSWTADGVVLCDGPASQCERFEVDLSVGEWRIALKVTDPEGAFDISASTTHLEPGPPSPHGGGGCAVAEPDRAGTSGGWAVVLPLVIFWLTWRRMTAPSRHLRA